MSFTSNSKVPPQLEFFKFKFKTIFILFLTLPHHYLLKVHTNTTQTG